MITTAVRQARPAWRSIMRRRAQDATSWLPARSTVVLAPHPDDETLGCGATIARAVTAGSHVTVVVAADGRSSHVSGVLSPDALAARRAAEVRAATAALGLDDARLVLLDERDDTLAARHRAVADRVGEVVDALGPAQLLVTSADDWHADHRALNAVALDVAADRPWLDVFAYPVWWWAEGPLRRSPGARRPAKGARLAVDVARSLIRRSLFVSTDGFLDSKRAALAAHRSQTENITGEAEWAVLGADFVDLFLSDRELFFPLVRSAG